MSIRTKILLTVVFLLTATLLCTGALADERFTINSNGTITKYTGTDTDLVIPNTIDGITVTSIGSSAFSCCRSLTSISIPDSVTSIDGDTFSGCSSLTSISIPDGVTSIGSFTFEGCSSLTSISIPDGVISIGGYAFNECSSLTSISIPDGVTSIGYRTFSGCSSLTSISIPDGVTSIGDWTFNECSSLTSISIPDGVTSIGNDAFNECSSLESVYAGSVEGWLNIKFGDFYSNPMYYADKLYLNGALATDIAIPASITSIGDWTFYECSSLTSISIPDGVTSIGEYAFYGCSSLTSISIPDGVTSIGEGAFSYCSNLTSISIPDGVTSISDRTFSGCSSLTSISIPDSVTSIGIFAFFRSNLTSISIPDGVTSIGESAFDWCNSLTSISIPDTVTSIGRYAFQYCYSLRHVVIPGNTTPSYSLDIPCSFTVYCYEYSNVDYWAFGKGYTTVYLDTLDMSNPIEFALTGAQNRELEVGKSITLIPQLFPAQENPVIQWSSSAPNVASVSGGVVTGHSAGSATITAVCGGKTATVDIEVYITATDFTIPDEIWVLTKQSCEADINVTPSGARTSYFCSYDDTAITAVAWGNTIELSGIVPGDTKLTISESYSGVTRECTVHVCYPVTAIEFVPAKYELFVDQTAQLTANITMRTQSAVNKLVDFFSDDTSVATVDKYGVVTGVAPGTTTITAMAHSGVTASCTVTVLQPDTLSLPAELKTIAAETFMKVNAEKIVIPDGCTTIGAKAFANSAKLVIVVMPDSVKSIADDAFEGCGNVTFLCESQNIAASFAEKHNIPCTIQ